MDFRSGALPEVKRVLVNDQRANSSVGIKILNVYALTRKIKILKI